MTQTRKKTVEARRMALYRRKARRAGLRRFEINLPARDAELVRHAVDQIREGGDAAARVREALAQAQAPRGKIAQSTQELYDMFRHSPFAGLDLEFERDKSLPPVIEPF